MANKFNFNSKVVAKTEEGWKPLTITKPNKETFQAEDAEGNKYKGLSYRTCYFPDEFRTFVPEEFDRLFGKKETVDVRDAQFKIGDRVTWFGKRIYRIKETRTFGEKTEYLLENSEGKGWASGKDLHSLTCAAGSVQDSPSLDCGSDLSSQDSQKLTDIATTFSKSGIQEFTTTEISSNYQTQLTENLDSISRNQEELTLPPSAHPVNPLASEENDSAHQIQETVSPQSSTQSELCDRDTLRSKTFQDCLIVPIKTMTNPQDSTLTGLQESWPASGTLSNGKLSAAPTLEAPGLGEDCLSLASPTALSSTEGRPPGLTKLEADLKEMKALAPGEVCNPEFLESGSGLPLGWTDPADERSALEFLAEVESNAIAEKPAEICSTPELQKLPCVEFSTLSQLGSVKAISLWQPWGELIIRGIKKFETRGWSTDYRGKLIIQAALIKDDLDLCIQSDNIAEDLGIEIDFENLPRGVAIAIANLTDCVRITEEFRAEQSEEELICGNWEIKYMKPRYAWKLENVQIIDPPIPLKGKQGIWDVNTTEWLEGQFPLLPLNPQNQDNLESLIKDGYLPISAIEKLPELQPRFKLYPETVEDYVIELENGNKAKPVLIYKIRDIEDRYILCDGWHRIAAAITFGMEIITVKVIEGTWAEAKKAAAIANKGNSRPLNPLEKERALEMYLDALEELGQEESLREIAKATGWGATHVKDVKRRRAFSAKIAEKGIEKGSRFKYKPSGMLGTCCEISNTKYAIQLEWDYGFGRDRFSGWIPLDDLELTDIPKPESGVLSGSSGTSPSRKSCSSGTGGSSSSKSSGSSGADRSSDSSDKISDDLIDDKSIEFNSAKINVQPSRNSVGDTIEALKNHAYSISEFKEIWDTVRPKFPIGWLLKELSNEELLAELERRSLIDSVA